MNNCSERTIYDTVKYYYNLEKSLDKKRSILCPCCGEVYMRHEDATKNISCFFEIGICPTCKKKENFETPLPITKWHLFK